MKLLVITIQAQVLDTSYWNHCCKLTQAHVIVIHPGNEQCDPSG